MIKIKRGKTILILWMVVLLGLGYSCYTRRLDWQLGVAFLIAFGLPSFLGKADEVKKP